MFKKIPVFALAFVSGSALAGPVGALLGGLTGSAPAPVVLPGLGSLPTQQLGQLTGGLATTADAAPLPGLGGGFGTEANAPGGAAIGVLDGGETGNGGMLGVAVLSGANSGNATGASGLGVGVLNENDMLHIGGCFMGTCMGDGQAEDPTGFDLDTLGNDLNSGLRGVLIPLTTTTLAAVTDPVGSGLEGVVGSIPVTEATLFGGADNNNSDPNSTINAGVLSGNNSGSGGTVGVAALSTSSETGSTAEAGSLAVGVLNGKAGTTPPPGGGVNGPIGGNPEEIPGGTVIGENSVADAGNRNALCSVLTKDSRGKVIGKTKVRCGALRSPNV